VNDSTPGWMHHCRVGDKDRWFPLGASCTFCWQQSLVLVEYVTEPSEQWPEGSECPVHRRVHSAHGWYVCVPGEPGD
jgi:hypothetical protein